MKALQEIAGQRSDELLFSADFIIATLSKAWIHAEYSLDCLFVRLWLMLNDELN